MEYNLLPKCLVDIPQYSLPKSCIKKVKIDTGLIDKTVLRSLGYRNNIPKEIDGIEILNDHSYHPFILPIAV